jgi:hypothetical protein
MLKGQAGAGPKPGDPAVLRITLKNAHLFALWCS